MQSISLVPSDSRTVQGTFIPKNVLILMAICAALIVVGGAYSYNLKTGVSKEKSVALTSNAKLQPLSIAVGKLGIKSSGNNNAANVAAQKTLVEQIIRQRTSWAHLVQQIYGAA